MRSWKALGEEQSCLKFRFMPSLAGLVSMEWLSWAIDDWLARRGGEPMGSLCFTGEAPEPANGEQPARAPLLPVAQQQNLPPPLLTRPRPPAPASTSSPRWVHTFAEIITHRIEPRCREASAALAVNSRFSLWSPEGSCIWILLRRHCAHVSGLCTGRRPEGAHGPIWWKPWRETKASVFERWNLIGLCRWPGCGGKKKSRPTPEFVHIERNTHTRRHLQNFKTKLFFSV